MPPSDSPMKRRLADAVVVHDADHVVDEHGKAVRPRRRVAAAVAARVVAQDAVARGQERDLRIPHGVVGREAVRQDEPRRVAAISAVDAGEELRSGHLDVGHSAASASAERVAAVTAGITVSAISTMERRASSRSRQSLPA